MTTTKRRKRSELSIDDCLSALEAFAKRVKRFGETSDGSMFGTCNEHGISVLPQGHINVVFAVEGSFGVGDDLFEAIRVLAGHKLPRKE